MLLIAAVILRSSNIWRHANTVCQRFLRRLDLRYMFPRYTGLQSLVKCLDHRDTVSDTLQQKKGLYPFPHKKQKEYLLKRQEITNTVCQRLAS